MQLRYVVPATVLAALVSMPAFTHGTESHAPTKRVAVAEQKSFGIAGDPKRVDRTIGIHMTDAMRFEPSTIRVRAGETIRFVHQNDGHTMHEMVIGTRAELEEHAALMRKHSGMEHDEPWMAHVAPGKRGEIVWKFNRTGEFEFACLIPGHFEAGMRGTVTVAAGK